MHVQTLCEAARMKRKSEGKRDSKRCYSLEHDGAHGPEGEADVKPVIIIKCYIFEYLNTPT